MCRRCGPSLACTECAPGHGLNAAGDCAAVREGGRGTALLLGGCAVRRGAVEAMQERDLG